MAPLSAFRSSLRSVWRRRPLTFRTLWHRRQAAYCGGRGQTGPGLDRSFLPSGDTRIHTLHRGSASGWESGMADSTLPTAPSSTRVSTWRSGCRPMLSGLHPTAVPPGRRRACRTAPSHHAGALFARALAQTPSASSSPSRCPYLAVNSFVLLFHE